MIDFKKDMEQCLKILHEGGTILYPTDTVWGLGCDATNEAAVNKIITLKNRPNNKSFIVLVADERELMQYVATIDLAIFDFLDAQTKPTTVIYSNAIGLAENVIAQDGSVAIRIVKDDFCKTLIKRFRKPIISTSANLANQPTPIIFSQIDDTIKQSVDYVVQYDQHKNHTNTTSAIVKFINSQVVTVR
jgi:L-threonylcarbamoyladenylate synthase